MNKNMLIKIIALGLYILTSCNVSVAQDVVIPNFWYKNERYFKPVLSSLPRMRFLTTTDFPPFNFIDRKKRLTGFHVDLARAVCEELEVLNRCQIQALPWEELDQALEKGEGEAIIAGISISSDTREKYQFSRPYLHIPGRFITRKDSGLKPPVYDAIFRKKTGVILGSAHAAYFKKAFANRSAQNYATKEAAFQALQQGEVDTVFSDALSLSFWMTSSASRDCCVFLDDAFKSNHFFGNGLSIAVPKDKPEMAEAMNYALKRINENGKFAELYLRYFPLGLY